MKQAGRMGQLDALRAFAVGAVMLHHFYPTNFLSENFPVGSAGLYLFFVLSGFLITGLLLRGDRSGRFIGEFYFRRALRLLPLYYLVVIALLLVSRDAAAHWPCYTFQIMNFCVTAQSRWGPAGHFWSLAAEEQFYLLWPFAVLFLSRRTLVTLCWALIVLAPLYRAIATYLTHGIYVDTLLTGVVDCLAAGALLALAPSAFPERAMLRLGLLGCGLAFLVLRTGGDSVATAALMPTFLLPLLCWLVAGASRGFQRGLGTVLSHPILRYIGRISYGMYVIHYFTIRLLAPVLPATLHPLLSVLALAALTIALASISWFLYERPINRLRDRLSASGFFGLVTPRPVVRPAAAAARAPAPAEIILESGAPKLP